MGSAPDARNGPRRLAFALGDTAGHTYPALAVAEAYQAAGMALDPLFFGPAGGDAARLVADAGFRFEPVAASAIARQGFTGALAAMVRALQSLPRVERLLRTHGSQAALGFGGYVSGSVLMAARWLGLPTAIHEANAEPGLANRLLAPRVGRVLVSLETAAVGLRNPRRRVTGLPIRAAIAALASVERRPPGGRAARVLVLSGSRGSDFLARAVPPLIAHLARGGFSLEVLHQARGRGVEALRETYASLGIGARIEEHLHAIAEAYAWADVAICRAGAGTLAELAAAGLPTLLVPLADAAHDHQAANACAFAEAGACLWTREADWQPAEIASGIGELLADPSRWIRASRAARALAAPLAARTVMEECEAAVRNAD